MDALDPAEDNPSADQTDPASRCTPTCGDCGRSLDIKDPHKIVCVASLEYRDPANPEICAHFLAPKQNATSPRLNKNSGDTSVQASPTLQTASD